ncbi:MAG: 4'-phosphopantetheinyl transferase superfamily protein [Gammaproteobacteria bacterium]|nr:4'-phosphopantetheinyl transferase superfamily protein [Gammaproteobacteria bacterium]
MLRPTEPWWQPLVKAGCATVVQVDLSSEPARETAALKWLDHQETARWRRARHPRRKRQFLLCRAALRAILCERLGCANGDLRFVSLEHGKPGALVRANPVSASFNLTHSGDHGLIAYAPGGRLGVDVEERHRRHDPDGPIKDVFTVREQQELANAQGDDKIRLFFRLWTLKEAAIKALGTGFSLDPARFEIPGAMFRGHRCASFRFPHLPDVPWRLDDIGNSDFAAAVAHETLDTSASEDCAL